MPLALIIAQALLQYGPELAGKIAALLHSTTEPTVEDWHAINVRTLSTSSFPRSSASSSTSRLWRAATSSQYLEAVSVISVAVV